MKNFYTAPGLALLIAGSVLSANVLACADCEHKKTSQETTPAPAASLAPVPAAEGMVVTRDAVTGQLRAPTAAEVTELENKAKAIEAKKSLSKSSKALLTGKSSAAPKAMVHSASGARGAHLGDEHATYSVVTRQSDGSLSTECIDGKAAADDAVKVGLPATTQSSPSKE